MSEYFKIITRLINISLLIFLIVAPISAQVKDPERSDKDEVISIFGGTRGYSRTAAKESAILNNGLQKYLRFSIHDGNLITGGIVNSGLHAYHYVSGSPFLSWPKGPKAVQYLHGAVFYVAAEVIDERGDTIHIVSDNYRRGGETALDQSHFYGFMPLPEYFNDRSPNSQEWSIGGLSEDVGVDGFPNTNDEGEGDGILQSSEDINRNGLLDVPLLNTPNWFAISHRKETWPAYWPVGSYPGDDRTEGETRPGVRAGRWNGEFGSYIRADQESYFAITDRENDEFNYFPFDDADSKRPWPNGRRGLGLKVDVRNYQWNARLAEDILISIYDIENLGKDLDKTVVGMYVDPDMGGSLSGDDASFDEVDDITYAFNLVGVASNGLPVGYFGFAFLESPGLPGDGIDNDVDGFTDESQNNGIDDDGDWLTWEDLNANGIFDNEDKNYNGLLDSGEDINNNGRLDWEPLNDDLGSDGLGPEFEDYTGPDPDGTEANGLPDDGEPNFEFTDNDESDQVGLTSFYLRDVDNTMANDERYWNVEIKPNVFAVRPGYQRDIAWSYGSGYVSFSGTEKIHRYAIAFLFGNDEEDILRNKKTMQVIYDNDYNFAKPPRKPVLSAIPGNKKVFLQWDDKAERSRDPIYGNDFEAYYIYKSTDPNFSDIKTISDAFGNPFLFKPLAIFDLDNGLKGVHPVRIGSEIGQESDLGVSYNMGTDSGVKHFFVDDDVTNGRTYYYAVVSVDRGYHPSFYPLLAEKEGLQIISPTESSASIQTDLLGRAINNDINTAIVIPMEEPAGWVQPEINTDLIKKTAGFGTGKIELEIYNPNAVLDNNEYEVIFSDDNSFAQYGNAYTGITSNVLLFDKTNKLSLVALEDPDNNPLSDEFIRHGIRVKIFNDVIDIDTIIYDRVSANLQIRSTTKEDNGVLIPRDYEIRIYETGIDTSVNNIPTNFQIWDVTDPDSNFRVKFRYVGAPGQTVDLRGVLSAGDKIQIVSDFSNTKRLWIFQAFYESSIPESERTIPQNGDIFKVISKKSFDRNDKFYFSVTGNNINENKVKDDLKDIYTVPDPYIAVSTLERKIIQEAEGRGDRRIDFVNLPTECTISIFTTSGNLVRKIEHSSVSNQSRASWDLRTKDGLEISHGIYFWVVEVPGGSTKTGRLAVIK